ncbi:MAG TPA: pyrroloquinoline quinone biosynthesis protein PqqE [Acetobacteraceae bacterium]|nr:pyrroloquinoline quinone biosynthesis protein PqqE [Acetobacteraceae bacterium]
MNAPTNPVGPPLALLAELTHRCPLGCPYCSNPLTLDRVRDELDTATWLRVIDEAASLGVLQIHFSGGEPLVRRDLATLIGHARKVGLYTNLITSAVLLDAPRLESLKAAGLEHVQISFQDTDPANADRIALYEGGHEKKLAAARMVRAAGLALTINAVMHRQNLAHLPEMIALALDLGAGRLEVAHVQYYGWALANRQSLIPPREEVRAAVQAVAEARERLKGQLVIDHVVPDYYARRPKACMGGWAQQFLNIAPSGLVLPCHAAQGIPGLRFDSVKERSLGEIWTHSEAFTRFRGTSWMPEPCRSCDRREIDFGGCRCQAMALTGDAGATDPACELSPHHARLFETASAESAAVPREFTYRRYAKTPREEELPAEELPV